MRELTVLYDGQCGLCIRARNWLQRQPKHLAMRFVAQNSDLARQRHPHLCMTDPPQELIVVSDDGKVYRDSSAWIMCLYALREHRPLALRLAHPALRGLARQAFSIVSRHRRRLSRWLMQRPPEALARQLRTVAPEAPRCHVAPADTTTGRLRQR